MSHQLSSLFIESYLRNTLLNIIKCDASANRILLPGDILTYSTNVIDYLKFCISYYFEEKHI